MRRLALVAGLLLLVLVAAVVAAAVLLPGLVDTPAMRERIATAVRDATGRELTYASLSAGVLPPRVEVEKPMVSGAAPGEEPLLQADSVSLRVAVLPLLSGAVVLESLRIDGAKVHVVREKPPASPPPAGPADAPSAESESAPRRLGVETLDLENGTVTLEDRTVDPPATLRIEDLDVRARREGVFDPVSFDAHARLGDGGDVQISGTVDAEANVDATATLTAVETKGFAPWIASAGKVRSLGGRASGTVQGASAGEKPTAIEATLVLEDAAVELEGVSLQGKLGVTSKLAPVEGGLGGPFEIDATEAELGYAGAFRKPRGTAATAAGILAPAADGTLAVEEIRVKIKNFEGKGRVRIGPSTKLELAADPFDLAGFEALFPAAADLALGGRASVDALAAATEPTTLGGAVVLDGVKVSAKGQPPVTLSGRLAGAGDALRSENLVLLVAGQPVALELGVAPLSERAVGTLSATGRGVDVEALIAAFSNTRDTITGPLRFDAAFRAPLASGKPIPEVVTGTLDFQVGPGKLKGVSLLKETIDNSGPVVQAAVAAGQAFGGRDVKRMYADDFESISGKIQVNGVVARFDPLRIDNGGHRVDLRGRANLATRGLDATGAIVFPDQKGAGSLRGQTLKISHIGGTLDKPRVELSPEDIASIVAKVSGSALERQVDGLLDKLGGSSLRSFLGGKKRN